MYNTTNTLSSTSIISCAGGKNQELDHLHHRGAGCAQSTYEASYSGNPVDEQYVSEFTININQILSTLCLNSASTFYI